ncbi:aminoglycoside phosphotransferase, partial [Streptomyces sp. NRRL F-6602]
MHASEGIRAVAVARSVAASLGLPADDQVAEFEVGLARQLAEAGCPVGALDPR